MIRIKYGTKEDIFLTLYGLFCFLSVIDLSLLSSQVITNALFGGIILALLLILIYNNCFSINNFVLFLFILFAFSAQLFTNGQKKNLIYGLLIIASSFSHKKKIALVSAVSCTVALALVVSASLTGVIPNLVFFRAGKCAYALGFGYYGTYPYLILFAELIFLYVKDKVSWLHVVLLIIINSVVYYFSSLRLPYYLFFICIILYIVLEKMGKINLNKGIIKAFSISGYPLCFILSVYASLQYEQSISLWRKINWVLSDRIRLMNVAFSRYDVKLFGQVIEKNTFRPLVGVNPNYFFIDSGYISSLLENGVILTVLLLLIHSWFLYYACKNNLKKEFILLIAVMIFSLINGVWTSLYYNPLLLLVFSQSELKYRLKLLKKNDLKPLQS